MKNNKFASLAAIVALSTAFSGVAIAADDKKTDRQPTREEIRKELESLPPEKREAKLLELRKQFGSTTQPAAPAGAYGGKRPQPGQVPSPEMRARLQREMQNMTPEQREARMKELREQFGKGRRGQTGAPSGRPQVSPEMREKMMREMRGLSPEERRAKMQEFFKGQQAQGPSAEARTQPGGGSPRDMTPEQRESRMNQAKERIAALEKKQVDGTITEREAQMLQRMKQFSGQRRGPQQGNPQRRRPQQN